MQFFIGWKGSGRVTESHLLSGRIPLHLAV